MFPTDKFISHSVSGVISFIDSVGYTLQWRNAKSLISHINFRGSGMVLSEVVAFCGKLFTTDRATGILYEIFPSSPPRPRHVLMG